VVKVGLLMFFTFLSEGAAGRSVTDTGFLLPEAANRFSPTPPSRWTKKAAVISDRTKTYCFAPALIQRNKLQKISQKYKRIIQKL
jgi:hypothetical protein